MILVSNTISEYYPESTGLENFHEISPQVHSFGRQLTDDSRRPLATLFGEAQQLLGQLSLF